MDELTHIDSEGRVRMVDVGEKPPTDRRAVAQAVVEVVAIACVVDVAAGGLDDVAHGGARANGLDGAFLQVVRLGVRRAETAHVERPQVQPRVAVKDPVRHRVARAARSGADGSRQ